MAATAKFGKAAEGQDGARAKRAAVLEAATAEFNAHGVGRASFSRIAAAVGITRAALYYYVKDRQDLVRQCYERTCAQMAADLDAADAGGGAGLERLLAFVRRALDPERAPCAVLSELHYLEGEARAAIDEAHGTNVFRLRALIREGMADRSLRRCDDEAIAQGIVGVLGWIPLSVDWLEGRDEDYRGRTVEALEDMLRDGIAADPAAEFVPPISARAFIPAPPGAFDREAQAAAKLEQILLTASTLFNRKGIEAASLDEITAALGATKGAFYHYFASRPELMTRCYRRAMDLFEAFADAADRLGRTGLDKGNIGLWLNVQAHTLGLAPLVQMVGVESLPAPVRAELRRRSRALQQRFTRFQNEGIAEGVTRPVDVATLAQLGAGLFEWLPKWFPPGDPRAETALAAEYVKLFNTGLRRR